MAKRVATDGGVNDTFIDVDLRKFTSGFSNAPVFILSAISGGTATLQPNGYTVRFVPALNTFGRGKFSFTVTDSGGSTWTQQCGILVSASGVPRDLIWQGDNTANAWDSATNNWTAKGAATLFSAGDTALFNDLGSATPAINLTSAMAVGAVTVDAAKNHTFSGSGSLTGAMALTKAGTGTLALYNTTANTYSGGTFINSGALTTNSVSALGSGAVTLANATLALTSAANLTLPNAIAVTGANTITALNNTNFSGAFSGSGDLSVSSAIFTPNASWAGYTGKLTMTNSGSLRFNQGANPWGAANAQFDAGTSGTIRHRSTIAATTITLGALSGGASSFLRGSDQDGGVTDTFVIGGLNLDTTFAGTITNGTGATTPHITAFTKSGSGSLTLSGASTYTGATTVSTGALLVANSLGTTPVTVAGGALLGGSGSLGGSVTASAGAYLSPGTTPFTGATMTVNGGLTLTGGGTLYYDMSSTPAGANDKIVMGGGTLAMSGTLYFQFLLLEGIIGAGTYDLVSGATNSTASSVSFTHNLPAGSRQTFTISRPPAGSNPSYIRLTVAGSTASLVWTGANGNVWDASSTVNWSGAADGRFITNDAVTFNDTVTNGGITLNSTVLPRVINITNNTTNYTLSGPGSIGGAGVLNKSGTGTLTIAPTALSVVATTTTNSTAMSVASTTGMVAGMAVEGSGIPAGTTIATIVDGANLTLSQAASVGNTNMAVGIYAKNTFTGGTTIGAGSTILLASDTANASGLGTGWVTLNGGTLTMSANLNTYNAATYDLNVPTGQTGTLNADSRCDLYGTLGGGGTLNLRIPWIRTTLFSDWSAFTGTINVTTDGNAEPGGGTPTGGDFRMGTDYSFPGFPQATVHLGDKVWAYYTGILNSGAGTTIEIGELSGTALSGLLGGSTGGRNFTYRIGGKTLSGSEIVFAGTIAEQSASTTTSFVKTGAGIWTLSGVCNWSGGTTVEQGDLKISGTVTCGSSTSVAPGASVTFTNGSLSTDALNIAAGATMSGAGSITGDLNNSGTVTCGSGTLSVTGDVVNNGTLRITSGAALTATAGFVNNGVLDLLTGAQGLPPNLENNGIVIDSTTLHTVAAAKNGNTVTVTVKGHSAHSYQLQRTDSLTAPNWTSLSGSVGTGTTQSNGQPTPLTLTDANATGTQRFYRVQVTP